MTDDWNQGPPAAGRALFASTFYPFLGIQGRGFALRGHRGLFWAYLTAGLISLILVFLGLFIDMLNALGSFFSDHDYPRTGLYIAAGGALAYILLWLSAVAVEAKEDGVFYPLFLAVVGPPLGLLGQSLRLAGQSGRALIMQVWGFLCLVPAVLGGVLFYTQAPRAEAWGSVAVVAGVLFGILWAAGIAMEVWRLRRHPRIQRLLEVQ